MCLPKFQIAAASVATFELLVRLLADQFDEGSKPQRAAIGTDLSQVIDVLADYHKASDDDRKLLQACAVLRNKLFHLELSRVTGRVKDLGAQLEEGKVWGFTIPTGDGGPVSKTKTPDGRIYGWMWEAARSGAFDAVVVAMQRGAAVIERWRDAMNGEALAETGLDPDGNPLK